MKSRLITILSGCSALAAAITPISLASCGSNGGGGGSSETIGSWSKGEVYTPMTPKDITETFTTNDKVTEAYHDDLLQNKMIWCDDKVYDLYVKNNEDHVTYDISKMSCSIGEVYDIETISSVTDHAIFRLDFDFTITGTITLAQSKIKLDFKNRKMMFKNVPIRSLYQKPEGAKTYAIYIKCDIPYMLSSDDKWSVNYPELIKDSNDNIVIGPQNVDYSLTNWPDDSDLKNTLSQIIQQSIDMKSNYYSKGVVGQ